MGGRDITMSHVGLTVRRVGGMGVALLVALGGTSAAAGADESAPLSPKDTLAYVGTYTKGQSKGIYVFRLQTQHLEVAQNITLVPLGLAVETPNPAFLEVDAKR